jgi:biopolymer transport protein ExbB
MIESLARFFSQGGIFMWLILVILAAAMAVIIERVIFYFFICRNNSAEMVAGVARALNQDKSDEALSLVSRKKAPLNVILATAITRFKDNFSYTDIKQGVDEVAIKEIPKFPKRLNYLAMFANIATLAGLLGTIFGLQQSFSSLGLAEAAKKATMLASGISQAMNTTAFGLMVAIPCMIAFSVLSNKQAHLTEDLDEAVVKILNYMENKLKPQSH